jgi:hypothetical protein
MDHELANKSTNNRQSTITERSNDNTTTSLINGSTGNINCCYHHHHPNGSMTGTCHANAATVTGVYTHGAAACPHITTCMGNNTAVHNVNGTHACTNNIEGIHTTTCNFHGTCAQQQCGSINNMAQTNQYPRQQSSNYRGKSRVTATRNMSHIQCHKCFMFGQMQRDCKTIICQICKMFGHEALQCQNFANYQNNMQRPIASNPWPQVFQPNIYVPNPRQMAPMPQSQQNL